MSKETPANVNREMSHEEWASYTQGWTWEDWEDFNASGLKDEPDEDASLGDESEFLEDLGEAVDKRPGELLVNLGVALIGVGGYLTLHGDQTASVVVAAGCASFLAGLARLQFS